MLDLGFAFCAVAAGGVLTVAAGMAAPLLGLGGAPGAMVHLAGVRSGSSGLRSLGALLCFVGQAYVTLVLVAFVVESIRSLTTGSDLRFTVSVVWIMGWLVAHGPHSTALRDAKAADPKGIQHIVVTFTGWVPALFYWIFVVWPAMERYLGVGWVPHL